MTGANSGGCPGITTNREWSSIPVTISHSRPSATITPGAGFANPSELMTTAMPTQSGGC
ncbi:hypothetical protein [Streptomyces sp. RKAG293]|uniref:hypothetical protein n=1 Tax=Streptomyces sp. RKAG293 TaxID=2893403 RepID=UPI0020339500|nr:hypothetical protein [Streptomyces sp. RKAG293]MCM2422687.1 hypothetical protein [Streptomyces sp. RKAG293]